MTDERMGDGLWRALRALPPGAGVVFRHYATAPRKRYGLWLRARRIAQARGLFIVAAGPMPGADGEHNGHRATTASAHNRREAMRKRHAHYLFVSPVFATRSHPGASTLGPATAAAITRRLDVRTIALGGMTARRWRRIRHLGFDGWAAIDALSR
ncbi:MAG: thiamine phosphate synthase [Sphingomonas bacterium]|nr:thiamine phosphate synthase [Sphingomonas bacterium]